MLAASEDSMTTAGAQIGTVIVLMDELEALGERRVEHCGCALNQGIQAHPVPKDILTQVFAVLAHLGARYLNSAAAAKPWTHNIQKSRVLWLLAEGGAGNSPSVLLPLLFAGSPSPFMKALRRGK